MKLSWLHALVPLVAVLFIGISDAAGADDAIYLQEDRPDVAFTPAVRAKAEELGYDPLRIFDFVRNDLAYEVYFGLMKGPDGTLSSGGGNDYDLAALLVSLLRVSGVPARFVRGRIALPYDVAAEWTNTPDQYAANRYWRWVEPPGWRCTSGAPPDDPCFNEATRIDGPTQTVQRWQIWVEAKVPLARYRGAGGDPRGPAWIPLDPSFKLHDRQPGVALPIGTDPDLTFDYLGPDGLYSKIVPRNVLETFETQIRRYLARIDPGAALADVATQGPVRKDTPGLLPTALPYAVLEGSKDRDASLAALHTNGGSDYYYMWALYLCTGNSILGIPIDLLTTNACEQAGLAYLQNLGDPSFSPDPNLVMAFSAPSAELETQRISMTFPRVPGDPAGTVRVRLSRDGVVDREDAQLPPKLPLRAVVATYAPQGAVRNKVLSGHEISANGTYVLYLDAHGAGPSRTHALGDALLASEQTYPLVDDANGTPFVDSNGNGQFDSTEELYLSDDFEAQEALVGGLLHLAGAWYSQHRREREAPLAAYHHKLLVRYPIVGLISAAPTVDHVLGEPFAERPGGLLIDIKGAFLLNLNDDGTRASPQIDHFAEILGHANSELEHLVWEEVAGVEAVSTVRGFQLARAMGENIEHVTSAAQAQGIGSCSMTVTLEVDTWKVTSPPIYDCAIADQNVAVVTYSPGQPLNTLNQFVTCAGFQRPSVYPIAGGDCTGIDPTTYCELKKRFGVNQAWRAPVWDQDCPTTLGNTTTLDLRIADHSRFRYRDWDGHVFFAQTESGSTGSLTFGIEPHASSAIAGGGYSAGPQFYPPSSLDSPSFDIWDPATTYGDFLTANPAKYGLSPQEAAGAAGAYDINPLVNATIAPSTAWNLVGDPVSVINGNFHHVVTDLEIPGRGGFDLRLVRSYNSRLDYDGPLGHGWTDTFDQHLRVDAGDPNDPDDNRVIWVDGDGVERVFYDKPSGLITDGWVHERLSRDPADGSYTLKLKDGRVYRFLPESNGMARLDFMRDRHGNTIRCIYDADGHLSKVVDTAGRELLFIYDTNGFLHEIHDWTGRVWRYRVDGRGDLTRYWDPVQVAAGSAGRPVVYEYAHDQADPPLDHNLIHLVEPADRSPPDGVGDWQMTFEYWGNDRVRSHTNSLGETTSFEYDTFHKRTRVTQPDGSVETYVFDRDGNVIRTQSGRGVVRDYEYAPDTNDRTLEVDGLGFETKVQYDSRGNPLVRTDRESHAESWVYNAFSEPVQHIDRRGNLRRFEYDAEGNLLREWATLDGKLVLLREHRYDAYGNRIETCEHSGPGGPGVACTKFEYAADGVGLVRRVDALGDATRFELDALDRPVRTTRMRKVEGRGDREEIAVSTDYDPLDRVVRRTDPVGTAHEVVYDADGRVETRQTVVPQPGQPGPLVRPDARNTYDAADRRVSEKDALGNVTHFEYDPLGRVARVTTPMGRETRYSYDADGNRVRTVDPAGSIWTRAYDAEGRVLSESDPLGRRVETTYDKEGRVLEVTQVAPDPSGGPDIRRTIGKFTYDPEGNVTRSEDAAGHVTTTVYDELGRPRSVTSPVGVAGEEGTTVFRYDRLGRLLERTDAESHTTQVRYDPLGRVTEVTDPLGRTRSRSYDEMGSVVLRVNGAGEEMHYTYDPRGLLLHREGTAQGGDVGDRYGYDAFGRQVLAENGSLTFRADYDALDRPVTLSNSYMGTARRVYDADGFVSQVVYPNDAFYGFPEGVVVSYDYDARGELAAVIDPVAGYWLYAYDAAGRLVRKTQPTGVESQIAYTPEGFVDRIDVQAPDRSRLDFFDYGAYDALGNPGTITTNEGTTSVTYDARSFVKTVTYPGSAGAETFDYDRVGNRTRHLRRDGVSEVFDLDAADEVTAIRDEATNAVLESFAYDGAGRRTERAAAGGATSTYRYDALGRLTQFDRTGSTPYEMILAYDATGHRFARADTAGDAAAYFGEWVEFRKGETVRLVHGGGPDGVVGEVTKASQVGAFVEDAGGNLAHDVVYSGGASANFETQRYEAFGTVRAGGLTAERGFAGRPPEGQSGLLYLRARHYEPATGRFLTPDPLGLASDQRYAYAANNPWVYADPSGLGPQQNYSLASAPAFSSFGSIAASSNPPLSFAPPGASVPSLPRFANPIDQLAERVYTDLNNRTGVTLAHQVAAEIATRDPAAAASVLATVRSREIFNRVVAGLAPLGLAGAAGFAAQGAVVTGPALGAATFDVGVATTTAARSAASRAAQVARDPRVYVEATNFSVNFARGYRLGRKLNVFARPLGFGPFAIAGHTLGVGIGVTSRLGRFVEDLF